MLWADRELLPVAIKHRLTLFHCNAHIWENIHFNNISAPEKMKLKSGHF